jgi:DNA-binding PadR family transcriptional regulator
MGPGGPHHHGRRRRASRTRRRNELSGAWTVEARLERFVEPAVLASLRSGPTHGYDLAESLKAWMPDQQIDLGNLYRMLRSMEDEGIVRSAWSENLPGRARRTYELTDDGAQLLDAWIASLRTTHDTIAAFLDEYGDRPEGTS